MNVVFSPTYASVHAEAISKSVENSIEHINAHPRLSFIFRTEAESNKPHILGHNDPAFDLLHGPMQRNDGTFHTEDDMADIMTRLITEAKKLGRNVTAENSPLQDGSKLITIGPSCVFC